MEERPSKVERGSILVIEARLHKNPDINTASSVGLFKGSRFRILVIMVLAS